MTNNKSTLAIIWDYDGTLVDSRQKNFNVTRKILATIAGAGIESIAALQSLNAQGTIANTLQGWGVLDHFRHIVGYEQVDYARQKPAPDGMLRCLEKLTKLTNGAVFYVGDHEVDARCASNANKVLSENGVDIKILCIGAFYGTGHDDSDWMIKPDFKAQTTREIAHIIQEFSQI
jgi:phosphoglycolate phosphatase-like HAD superfamily hydrolase